ncbi:DHS-like NAD/FAD-binding domain-containing protein [Aspergillus campestris IBT 28561]|uniref:DHS-like NAD/FAD-binding domain-containing protein n=1 Tax=Aspergillus campestris (strain IBT 28561) TaxID=1392248 RepID=A0A2I1CZJ7_ASPC2|nr:DHS-like NAD/FAD-binding domain-containing protein [Aspergillus campestris IBT 28561]PKY03021.1 DHS-like NAD/FAD-binding domain-containing protein [Aspergillus campestris IBT 28561]
MASSIPAADLRSFTDHLKRSKRVLALLGAGISASSGLPTFRGAGGLWRSHDATDLATPEAFDAYPDLVWQFYSYRRHMALKAQPNRAHYALAELARRMPDFHTLSQNVDGLSQRAKHPSGQLHLLHGSLFTVKCTSFYCSYSRENDFSDPITPALAIPTGGAEPTPSSDDKTGEAAGRSLSAAMSGSGAEGQEVDISDERVPLAPLRREGLPHCPECKDGLLRPGVVWFGESLPLATLDFVDGWMRAGPVDLILVVGTSSQVYPAAGYVDKARARGARVAVVNMDRGDGDAGVVVPEILRCVVGEV